MLQQTSSSWEVKATFQDLWRTSLHTINTDILEGKLNLKACYVILITGLQTCYTFWWGFSSSQDRDSHSGSKSFSALPLPKPNRSLIAASVSLHNLTAIRRFHSVGVKQQRYRPNRNTIRTTNDCRQNRTQVRPAELRAVKELLIEVSAVIC